MAVKDVMTTKLITVGPDETLERVAKIIKNLHINHVLVVEGSVLLGIISDRDILQNSSPFLGTHQETDRDKGLLSIKASNIMTPDPITIVGEESIRNAGKIILDNKISLLPVVNNNGLLVGVISWKDILRFAIQ